MSGAPFDEGTLPFHEECAALVMVMSAVRLSRVALVHTSWRRLSFLTTSRNTKGNLQRTGVSRRTVFYHWKCGQPHRVRVYDCRKESQFVRGAECLVRGAPRCSRDTSCLGRPIFFFLAVAATRHGRLSIYLMPHLELLP